MSDGRSGMAASSARYYGKYRGTVLVNIDPLQIGRIMAQVPDVFGETPTSWAMPCVPAAGIQAGCFVVPPIGSQVWIEFEQGDPDYPIWTGGFWGTIYIAVSIFLVPRLGTATFVALLVGGQMLSSLLFDHYGLFGLPEHPADLTRITGAVLLLAGVVLVRL